MKRLIIGVLMLIVPTGYIYYLCITSPWGFWRTSVIFIVTIGWTLDAAHLMSKGAEKLQTKG